MLGGYGKRACNMNPTRKSKFGKRLTIYVDDGYKVVFFFHLFNRLKVFKIKNWEKTFRKTTSSR